MLHKKNTNGKQSQEKINIILKCQVTFSNRKQIAAWAGEGTIGKGSLETFFVIVLFTILCVSWIYTYVQIYHIRYFRYSLLYVMSIVLP